MEHKSAANISIQTKQRRRTQTHKVKTLFHSGLRFLYTVCVCSRSLFSSSTQNGSLLPRRRRRVNTHTRARTHASGHWAAPLSSPFTSAAMSPSALITFTCTMPTSFRLERERSRRWGGGDVFHSFSLPERGHFPHSNFLAAGPENIN